MCQPQEADAEVGECADPTLSLDRVGSGLNVVMKCEHFFSLPRLVAVGNSVDAVPLCRRRRIFNFKKALWKD